MLPPALQVIRLKCSATLQTGYWTERARLHVASPRAWENMTCTITQTIRVCSSRWFLFYLLPWTMMLSKNKRSVNRQRLFDHWLINTCQATVVKDNFNDMTCYFNCYSWGWPWPTNKALETSVSSHKNSHNALGNTRWFCFCARRKGLWYQFIKRTLKLKSFWKTKTWLSLRKC